VPIAIKILGLTLREATNGFIGMKVAAIIGITETASA